MWIWQINYIALHFLKLIWETANNSRIINLVAATAADMWTKAIQVWCSLCVPVWTGLADRDVWQSIDFLSAGVCVGSPRGGKWRTVSAQPSHSHFPNTRYPTSLTKTGAPVRFLFLHCCKQRVFLYISLYLRVCVCVCFPVFATASFLPICLDKQFLSINTGEPGTPRLPDEYTLNIIRTIFVLHAGSLSLVVLVRACR